MSVLTLKCIHHLHTQICLCLSEGKVRRIVGRPVIFVVSRKELEKVLTQFHLDGSELYGRKKGWSPGNQGGGPALLT